MSAQEPYCEIQNTRIPMKDTKYEYDNQLPLNPLYHSRNPSQEKLQTRCTITTNYCKVLKPNYERCQQGFNIIVDHKGSQRIRQGSTRS